MRKRKQERHFLRELFTVPVLFRLAVAIIISFSISRPLEVAIYEKRLKAQIETDKQEFIRHEVEKRKAEMNLIQEPLDSLVSEGKAIAKERTEGPQTVLFKQNIEAYSRCNDELKTLKVNNENKIRNLAAQNQGIRNNPRYRDTINYNLTRDALNLISRNNNLIQSLMSEIDKKQAECQVFLGKANTEAEVYNQAWVAQESRNSFLLEDQIRLKREKEKQDSIALAEIEKKAKISFDSDDPGLITSLESLANFEKTPEGKKVWIVRLILLLIFICIDTAPIVVKLLTKYGPYEEMQEADEAKMRYLATAEKNANILLISNIATAQNRVLRLAIDQYAKEELDRLKQDASYSRNYVHNESSNNNEE